MHKPALRSAFLGLFLLLAVPRSAHGEIRLGGGADYWVNNNAGIFELLLGLDTRLVKHLNVGGRLGVLLVTANPTVGIPLDFDLRLNLARNAIYIDGLVGPWILFTDRPFRAHAGLGFGYRAREFEVGIETSWLDPNATVGLRLAFHL
jgi:hypothetical protein